MSIKRKQIETLLNICMEIQMKSGSDKELEKRNAKYTNKPCVFFEYNGHVNNLSIYVYKHGWKKESKPDFCFNSIYKPSYGLINSNSYWECKTYLEYMLDKMKKGEKR